MSVSTTVVLPLPFTNPSPGSITSVFVGAFRQLRLGRLVWARTSKRSSTGSVVPTGQVWFTVTRVTSTQPLSAGAFGFVMVTAQLPAGPAGTPQADGGGVGLGVGVGDGTGEGDGDGVGEGVGVGLGVGLGEGVGVGVGAGEPWTCTSTAALTFEVPAWAVML